MTARPKGDELPQVVDHCSLTWVRGDEIPADRWCLAWVRDSDCQEFWSPVVVNDDGKLAWTFEMREIPPDIKVLAWADVPPPLFLFSDAEAGRGIVAEELKKCSDELKRQVGSRYPALIALFVEHLNQAKDPVQTAISAALGSQGKGEHRMHRLHLLAAAYELSQGDKSPSCAKSQHVTPPEDAP